jgi:hypothetical protein
MGRLFAGTITVAHDSPALPRRPGEFVEQRAGEFKVRS